MLQKFAWILLLNLTTNWPTPQSPLYATIFKIIKYYAGDIKAVMFENM